MVLLMRAFQVGIISAFASRTIAKLVTQGFAYGLAAGFGNTEYSITAFSGVCLQDKLCWGHNRGMFYQWFRTSDASGRAGTLYGDKPPVWDFKKQQAADIVVINLGTNDANSANLPDPGMWRRLLTFFRLCFLFP